MKGSYFDSPASSSACLTSLANFFPLWVRWNAAGQELVERLQGAGQIHMMAHLANERNDREWQHCKLPATAAAQRQRLT